MPRRKPPASLVQFLDQVQRAERDLEQFHHIRSILSENQRRIFLQPLFDTVGELVQLADVLDVSPLTPRELQSFQGARERMLELQKQVRTLIR